MVQALNFLRFARHQVLELPGSRDPLLLWRVLSMFFKFLTQAF